MIRTSRETKLEYGDFQTPLELAEKVCQKLVELDVTPDVILEPTCGVGNFLEAAASTFQSVNKIIGVELNSNYLQAIKNKAIFKDKRVEIRAGNFFSFDWPSLVDSFDKKILVLGNLPWVTNSQQGTIGCVNLPEKTNFQNHRGFDAISGKSNFDISEWMLIQVVEWLQNRDAYLAMLCKTSVARKLLNYLHSQKGHISYCSTYKIDAKKYFSAAVEACLLFCKFDSSLPKYFCDVFSGLEAEKYYRIGYRNGSLVRNIDCFDKLRKLYDPSAGSKWRSGIKHDCSKVMEFRQLDNYLVNGLGEVIEIEDTYLFPLVKGSAVAQNRIKTAECYVLVTQKFVGEPTERIKELAPRTWKYLEDRAKYLDNRKSRIYQKNPRFSIFGVGAYSFAPWKIAICGLYKQLDFRLVGKLNDKPTVFDDTVYFLSFEDEQVASRTFDLLNSRSARDFYSSLIFWDEKRPIKSSILNRLNLENLYALDTE